MKTKLFKTKRVRKRRETQSKTNFLLALYFKRITQSIMVYKLICVLFKCTRRRSGFMHNFIHICKCYTHFMIKRAYIHTYDMYMYVHYKTYFHNYVDYI